MRRVTVFKGLDIVERRLFDSDAEARRFVAQMARLGLTVVDEPWLPVRQGGAANASR